MHDLNGPLGDLVRRLDALRPESLTKLAGALETPKLTVTDVAA